MLIPGAADVNLGLMFSTWHAESAIAGNSNANPSSVVSCKFLDGAFACEFTISNTRSEPVK
jgi:hypothetical protein